MTSINIKFGIKDGKFSADIETVNDDGQRIGFCNSTSNELVHFSNDRQEAAKVIADINQALWAVAGMETEAFRLYVGDIAVRSSPLPSAEANKA